MKLRHHIAVVFGVAIVFCGLSLLIGAKIGNEPTWYDAPVLFPLAVAIWVGGNPHNPSVVAGNLAWALECLLVGAIVDACIAFARRRSVGRKPGE